MVKNFRWMNTRVEKGFFEEKMANLKVFIAKHIVDSIHSRKQLSSALKYMHRKLHGLMFIIPRAECVARAVL